MKRQILIISTATAFLGACTASNTQTGSAETEKPAVPESVILMAAPNQNVHTARVLPSDNCYWYEYAGVVETTLLPLKTADGRKICAQNTEAGRTSI